VSALVGITVSAMVTISVSVLVNAFVIVGVMVIVSVSVWMAAPAVSTVSVIVIVSVSVLVNAFLRTGVIVIVSFSGLRTISTPDIAKSLPLCTLPIVIVAEEPAGERTSTPIEDPLPPPPLRFHLWVPAVVDTLVSVVTENTENAPFPLSILVTVIVLAPDAAAFVVGVPNGLAWYTSEYTTPPATEKLDIASFILTQTKWLPVAGLVR